MKAGRNMRRAAVTTAIWVAALVCWELAYRIVGWAPWVFPAPSNVLDSALHLLGNSTQGALLTALAVSGARLAVGFLLSTILGLALGVALWRWRVLDRAFGGVFLGLQALP